MNTAITNPINLILIIIGSFLGLSLGFFLLLNKSAKNKANLFLGVLVLAITTFFLPAFFYRFDLLPQVPHVIGVSNVVTFLIGPLAYLYVCACTQKGFQMRPLVWLHFLPFVLDILIQSPILLQSGAEKVTMYLNFVKYGNLNQPPFLLLIKTLQGVTYFALAIRLILRYRDHLSNTTSTIDTAFHRWILVFLCILAFPIFSLMGLVFIDFKRVLLMIVLLSSFLFFFAAYLAALVKPELFHAFPHQISTPESAEEQKGKYENSKLQEEQKEKYIEKVLAYIESEKPYQASELTLTELSEQVKIPAHYLSQVINEKLNVNFLDFINSYRVKDAQAKLTNPKLSHYTILAVAYDAGFNAKSTFYAVFKKHTGMTPSEYKKAQQA